MERNKIILILALLLSCSPTVVGPRKYKDITERQAVEIGTWKGWWVISYPSGETAIIRNNNRAIMIHRPKWMSEIWNEGDTIK